MTHVPTGSATATPPPTDEEASITLVDELCHRYRNWGRWGADDQRGTLNFITPQALIYAASMVRTGRVVSCGLPFEDSGPQRGGFGGRTNPVHAMLQDGGDIALGAQDHLADPVRGGGSLWLNSSFASLGLSKTATWLASQSMTNTGGVRHWPW